MKRVSIIVLLLSIILIALTIIFQSSADTIPRWWGWLVGAVDTIAEDGILTSVVALV